MIFYIFVANRVRKSDYTSPKDCRYRETDHNSADIASRGLTTQRSYKTAIYGGGIHNFSLWSTPFCHIVNLLSYSHRTQRWKEPSCSAQMHISCNFSSLFKTKKAVAVCLRYVNYLKERVNSDSKVKLRIGSKNVNFFFMYQWMFMRFKKQVIWFCMTYRLWHSARR